MSTKTEHVIISTTDLAEIEQVRQEELMRFSKIPRSGEFSFRGRKHFWIEVIRKVPARKRRKR